MYYCFMKMTTEMPGSQSFWGGIGVRRSYEMKILAGRSRKRLLARYVAQARKWLAEHPDRDALELTPEKIESALRYERGVLEKGRAKAKLADVLYRDVTPVTAAGTRCTITTEECWGKEFWRLEGEMWEKAKLPANPMDFDSNSIESAEAFEMLRGSRMDETSCWDRSGWRLRWNLRQRPGLLRQINQELSRIAHEPRLEDSDLRYFEAMH